ncbi:hypothetical protein PR048_006739 [Dryococelus australis]|uniref:Uncharacterized protein n=1 Tax=Dryococelus australis TaxID=614101 RepID=A0ABQ9ID12_9NEOP|nr:hypothetical protein PR048_006739 [Dryococelus australis]
MQKQCSLASKWVSGTGSGKYYTEYVMKMSPRKCHDSSGLSVCGVVTNSSSCEALGCRSVSAARRQAAPLWSPRASAGEVEHQSIRGADEKPACRQRGLCRHAGLSSRIIRPPPFSAVGRCGLSKPRSRHYWDEIVVSYAHTESKPERARRLQAVSRWRLPECKCGKARTLLGRLECFAISLIPVIVLAEPLLLMSPRSTHIPSWSHSNPRRIVSVVVEGVQEGLPRTITPPDVRLVVSAGVASFQLLLHLLAAPSTCVHVTRHRSYSLIIIYTKWLFTTGYPLEPTYKYYPACNTTAEHAELIKDGEDKAKGSLSLAEEGELNILGLELMEMDLMNLTRSSAEKLSIDDDSSDTGMELNGTNPDNYDATAYELTKTNTHALRLTWDSNPEPPALQTAVHQLTAPREIRRWNARAGETGEPRESGIVQHDLHMRKSGREPAGDQTQIAVVGGERPSHCATAAPREVTREEELDDAVSLTQRVLGDAAVGAEVRLTHVADLERHVLGGRRAP